MRKSIEARHNAHRMTQITLDKNQGIFASNIAFVNAFRVFANEVENSKGLILKAGSLPRRTAANKDLAREELAAVSLKISSALKVYCVVEKDNNLATMLVSSETQLSKSMKQQDFWAYNNQLINILDEDPEKFMPYGITDVLIKELKLEFASYSAIINEPRQLINERKTNLELLAESINKANQILREQIDPLMELFIDEHKFYLEYKSARIIIDPASRKKDSEED